jgi:hypothetical protein
MRNDCPSRWIAATYRTSQSQVSRQNSSPSASISQKDGSPFVVPNCGSRLVKKAAILGLPRSLMRPWR